MHKSQHPRSIALIIPTCNMAKHLHPLWKSIEGSGLRNELSQIIFVNDGSVDQTHELLDDLSSQNTDVTVIHLDVNQGRFDARRIGAECAQTERLLFLDSRITLPDNFGTALRKSACSYTNVVGCVDIETKKNTYCLYWQRTHEFIFWRYYRDTKKPLTLTVNNFDAYLKGTGVFVCSRVLFLQSCADFQDSPPLSDDTYLLKIMVARQPIVIDPSLRIDWVPRDTLKTFLGRLWERGPQFVEYHVLKERGLFFWISTLGVLVLVTCTTMTFLYPTLGLSLFSIGLMAVILSAFLVGHNLRESLQILPLHITVFFTSAASVLWGLLYHAYTNALTFFKTTNKEKGGFR